jgi:hypothetical protein
MNMKVGFQQFSLTLSFSIPPFGFTLTPISVTGRFYHSPIKGEGFHIFKSLLISSFDQLRAGFFKGRS